MSLRYSDRYVKTTKASKQLTAGFVERKRVQLEWGFKKKKKKKKTAFNSNLLVFAV